MACLPFPRDVLRKLLVALAAALAIFVQVDAFAVAKNTDEPAPRSSLQEQKTLIDYLRSGSRFVAESAAKLGKCYRTDEYLEALANEVARDIDKLDIERAERRLDYASKKYASYPLFKLITASVDVQEFRGKKALALIDAVIEECSLATNLYLYKAQVLVNLGQLDAAEAALEGVAPQALYKGHLAYYRALIAYHRGDLSGAKQQLADIESPALLGDAPEQLAQALGLQPTEASPAQVRPRQPLTGRPTTPGAYASLLEEAALSGDAQAVIKLSDAFETRYPSMALAKLLAFYAAFEVEDFSGAGEFLKRFAAQAPNYPQLALLQGRLARATGRFGDAKRAYEAQIAATPSYRWPYEELFDTYMEAGEYSQLIAMKGRFAKQLPQNYHQLLRTAKAYRSLGRFDDALATYDKAIALDPDISVAYRGKATTYYTQARWEEARTYYELSLEIDPVNSEGLTGLAGILRNQGEYAPAMAYAEKALRRWPKSLLANIEYAQLSYQLGRVGEAQERCDQLEGILALGHYQRLNQAYCYEHTGAEEKAFSMYEALYRESPQPSTLQSMGEIRHRQGSLEEARELLRRAWEQSGGEDLSIRQAYVNVLYKLERWPQVEAEYAEIIQHQRNRATVWAIYGYALRRQDKYTQALGAYDEAIALDPHLLDAVYGKAWCLEQLGKHQQAAAAYGALLEIPGRAEQAHTELAKFAFRRKDYSGALQHARAGLEIAATNPELLLMAADASHNTHQHPMKVQYAIALIGTGYEEPRHLDWAAIHYAGAGKLDHAQELFHKIVELEPTSQLYHSNLGYSYYVKGDYGKALAIYKKALELTPQTLGPNHTSEALLFYNIGLVQLKLADKPRAESAFRRARSLGYPPAS